MKASSLGCAMSDKDDQRKLEGKTLWEPSSARKNSTNLFHYQHWLSRKHGLSFDTYQELWQWSVSEVPQFWESVWDYFQINSLNGYSDILKYGPAGKRLEGAKWFIGAELNYAQHALRLKDEKIAVIGVHESGSKVEWTRNELFIKTSEIAAGLRDMGVRRGDSVVAYMPNIPEAVAAALAVASIGAFWSSCPPEFGTRSVIDRFQQLSPKVLLAVDGYQYGGKSFSSSEAIGQIQDELPSLENTIVLPYLDKNLQLIPRNWKNMHSTLLWPQMLKPDRDLIFEQVPFDHPLCVVYSSGTTGSPKAIVHGHGGALLEHFKLLSLHMDLGENDRFFWFSTTGWIMWNILMSGLLVGASIVLYDGNPGYPDMKALWQMADDTQLTCLGVSAPYIQSCLKAGLEPGKDFDLDNLKTIGSTGAPLSPEGFEWVYDKVKADLLLASVSGGTDVLTAFLGGGPTLPVVAGELQCICLGCKVESFNESGLPVTDEVGELVVTEPMPSMPIYFLNDPEGARFHESYFDVYPDAWRHGDWIKITENGTAIVYGRSDSTLNRSGVRMGTSEFYRVVEEFPEIADSLVIDTSRLGIEGKLLLFVVLQEGLLLNEELKAKIAVAIRSNLSPRHVPDEAYAIKEVPRTLNGKKLEVPIKKILSGVDVDEAVSKDALVNPGSLEFFADLAVNGSY